MACIHETIAGLLKQSGLKVTKQRERILEILLQSDVRLRAEDIYLLLKQENEEFGLSTVYRTLSVLTDQGIVERIDLPEHHSQFYNVAHQGHRHQLTCTQCKRTILLEECPAEECLAAMCKKYGFQITGHSFEIFGICPQCAGTVGKPAETE